MSDIVYIIVGTSERYDDGFERTWLVWYRRTMDAAIADCNMLNLLADRMDLNPLTERDTTLSGDPSLFQFVREHGAVYMICGVGEASDG